MNPATTEDVELNNAKAVLAYCLVKSQHAYLGLIEDGFSSDDLKDVGRTVRHLARCLADVTVPFDEFDDEPDDPERENWDDAEQNNNHLKLVKS